MARKRPPSCGLVLLAPLLLALDLEGVEPQIVNGVLEPSESTTAALLEGSPETGRIVCSAVLIGCDVALSAGHCFNPDLPDPPTTLFLQHAGFFAIASATRHPVYAAFIDDGIGDFFEVTRQEDIALVELATPVTGITPSTINTVATPSPGTDGRIAGFGRDEANEISVFRQNTGIKRSGDMTTQACVDPSLSPWDVICWPDSTVMENLGEEVSPCSGDSGGPLFVDAGGVRVLAGLTKGAIPGTCEPPIEAYDTNVFRHRDWIAATAASLGLGISQSRCSAGGQIDDDAPVGTCDGSPWNGDKVRFCGFDGEVNDVTTEVQHSFQVPSDTAELRVALNGTSRLTNPVDVDFFVRAGAPATTTTYDCAGDQSGSFAYCDFADPQAGTWYVLAAQGSGTAEYQITVTQLAPVHVPAAPWGLRLGLALLLAAWGAARTGGRRPGFDDSSSN